MTYTFIALNPASSEQEEVTKKKVANKKFKKRRCVYT
jgi:hypothetical protein